ncbi:MAG: hypothetical protein K0Q79_221 [Flavipsychrobacter sp.]|jgi:uncharacterized membrane protein (DUF106 family)|nr:hypothetical protein [Flavipsychrobacter sp.]
MLKILIWLIIIAILFRALVRFIFPIAHITSTTNDRLKKMQDQLNEMNRQAQKAQEKERKKPSKRQGDYIDYEEM